MSVKLTQGGQDCCFPPARGNYSIHVHFLFILSEGLSRRREIKLVLCVRGCPKPNLVFPHVVILPKFHQTPKPPNFSSIANIFDFFLSSTCQLPPALGVFERLRPLSGSPLPICGLSYFYGPFQPWHDI